MRVEIISATNNPADVISIAAGVCYGKSNISWKRVVNCFKSGHMSVFEHASASFRIEGISRSCMAQLTRHRLSSFCVESQRYCRYVLDGDDWYVVPELLEENADYHKQMGECAGAYKAALAAGIKPEDARYLLPEATKTNLVMTCNVRELFHIADMRTAQAAQWEIRDLVNEMLDQLEGVSEQWYDLVGLAREEA